MKNVPNPLRVALADYGAGNLLSLCFALERARAAPFVTTAADEVRTAPLAVIAGVGHVKSAAAGLAKHGLDGALRDRVAAGRPVAGICVGLQLLFEESEEGGVGLGLLAGPVRRIEARRVPHMGWNTLATVPTSAIVSGLDGADVYFAHSFAATPAESSVIAATVEHDGTLVAAVESDGVAGVQFHPERSAAAGARVLDNLLRWSKSV
ncbi:MAG: imidazole glycerol phosphate synthase subunit HisH [Gaiellales bacterium]